ncbi:MAG: Der GTPase-activating protein YihI [Aeromonas sp.]
MSINPTPRKPTGKRQESEASILEGRARKRAARRKGLKAGSRQQVASAGQPGRQKVAKDPRIGSRKPIALLPEQATTPRPNAAVVEKKIKPLTAAQELAAIENDERLNDLLDRLDNGETLSATEQSWVDERVDRYQVLMDELGIVDNDDDEDDADMADDLLAAEALLDEDERAPSSEDELWERFNHAQFTPETAPKKK